jgi:putative flippase GtrA
MKFTKKDLFFSIATGLIAGIILWLVFSFLGSKPILGVPYVSLIIIIPILWIIGVNLGFFLGKWFSFFDQFGKFAAIGFTNFAVNLGILNLLIYLSGIDSGFWYSAFVVISFIVAATHSYIWNKFWAFESKNKKVAGEFAKFVVVSVIGAVINTAIATILVNVIGPKFGFSSVSWANIGSIAGSAVALIFNFIGFRLAVFNQSASRN